MVVEAEDGDEAVNRAQDQSGWHWEATEAGLTSPFELRMELITIRSSDDPVKMDMELTCGRCTGVICDVEHDDTLDLLMRTATSHLDGCEGLPCKHCGHEIFKVDGAWVAPSAGTDREFGDGVWRDSCPDSHEDRIAAHEPKIGD